MKLMEVIITLNEYIEKRLPRYQLEIMVPITGFFEDLNRQGKIRTDIMPGDIAILCLALANGMIHNITGSVKLSAVLNFSTPKKSNNLPKT